MEEMKNGRSSTGDNNCNSGSGWIAGYGYRRGGRVSDDINEDGTWPVGG